MNDLIRVVNVTPTMMTEREAYGVVRILCVVYRVGQILGRSSAPIGLDLQLLRTLRLPRRRVVDQLPASSLPFTVSTARNSVSVRSTLPSLFPGRDPVLQADVYFCATADTERAHDATTSPRRSTSDGQSHQEITGSLYRASNPINIL